MNLDATRDGSDSGDPSQGHKGPAASLIAPHRKVVTTDATGVGTTEDRSRVETGRRGSGNGFVGD